MVMLHIRLNGTTECSNMVANILPADPTPTTTPPPTTLGGRGQKLIIQPFQNMVMFHFKLNAITKCNNMVANILPALPPTPLDPRGVKDQNSTFSEQFHVANQIKWNQECRNMVANILPAYGPHPLILGLGV